MYDYFSLTFNEFNEDKDGDPRVYFDIKFHNTIVGRFDIYQLKESNWVEGNIEVYIMINEDLRGLGIGKRFYSWLLTNNHIFEILKKIYTDKYDVKIDRLIAKVNETNLQSLKLHRNFFEEQDSSIEEGFIYFILKKY